MIDSVVTHHLNPFRSGVARFNALLAERLEVPLLGQVPLVPHLREGGDSGRPITAVEPDSEAAQAFRRIAERVDVELAPTRRYRPQLRIS